MKTINSHDKYFKEVFSKKEEATAFLKGSLPKELVKNINFDSLAPLKDSYIDEELKENFSDLVFTCKYKGKKRLKSPCSLNTKANRCSTRISNF